MTQGELNKVLELHKKWILSSEGGIRANLRDANLSNASLSGANLSGANLRDANLSNANLRNADLSNANLSNANLSNANLRNANLSDANLSDANLSDANLSDADLNGANLNDIKNYENNHNIFMEVIKRQVINFLNKEEKILVFDIFNYRLCWNNIKNMNENICLNMFIKLSDLGYTEWLNKYKEL